MASEILRIHEELTSGKISCTELVKAKLSELEKNTHNTANFLLTEIALEKAAKVDEKIKNGEELGLLEGIPFGVKDVFLVQGCPASASSDFLKNYKSPYTATAIQKLLDAGAIPLVKENCDSFGHGSTNENTVFGPVKNAVNEELVGGGSSGGSAVNVAKGYTTFSIGGDTGGSIRQPAGFNKVYGLKPTYGRVSRYGIMAYASSTDCVGPIASSIEDIQLVLNTISGKDYHDQTTFVSEPVDLTEAIDASTLSVGYYTEFIENEGLDAETKAEFLALVDKLKAANIEVKPLNFKNADVLVSTYYALVMAETASNLARLDGSMYGGRIDGDSLKDSYAVTRSENFTEETKRRIVGGNQVLSQGHSDEIYTKATALRSQIISHFEQDLKEVSIIISPVSPTAPPKIGGSLKDPLAMYLSDIYTIGFSLGELPTLTAPVVTETGLQITATKAQEELILKFAKFLNEII
ncbi:MAG: Asp-tRNA(Asn)/Glu-tRNA(Gln) amidotransferase subunit GatA [Cytophagales bacterium]|nr:Asp-tRNA(Asn)/Glu-tRNA(Gln) amidotransferase subunit GatA [Cytophagales bacterium]